LEQADERVLSLQQTIKKLQNDKMELEEMVELQDKNIQQRDREISRLNDLNIGAKNIDKVSQEYNTEMTRANMEKLNCQIDFLNQENQRLEREVKEKDQIINTSEKYKQDRMAMSQKFTELQKENKRLLGDISQMETVIQDLKDKIEDNFSVLAKRKLVPLADLTKERDRRIKIEDEMKSIETELRQYKRADEDIQHGLKTVELEKKKLNEKLEELVNENRKLQNTIDEKLHEVRQVAKERDILRSDSDYYKGRAKEMESNYERYKKMSEELSQEKNMTSGEYYNKLLVLENELSETKRENSEMAFELDRIKRQKIQYEQEVEELKETSFKFKNEFETNQATLNRINMLYETTLRDKQRLEKEVAVKEKELAERLKNATVDATNESVRIYPFHIIL
jgi:chromosome segregation ATPase